MIVNILNHSNTQKKKIPNFCQITPTSYLNKEAYILQIEGGQQPAKRRRRYDHVDSKLHQYGLEYITCERDFHSYFLACSHSVSGCWN